MPLSESCARHRQLSKLYKSGGKLNRRLKLTDRPVRGRSRGGAVVRSRPIVRVHAPARPWCSCAARGRAHSAPGRPHPRGRVRSGAFSCCRVVRSHACRIARGITPRGSWNRTTGGKPPHPSVDCDPVTVVVRFHCCRIHHCRTREGSGTDHRREIHHSEGDSLGGGGVWVARGLREDRWAGGGVGAQLKPRVRRRSSGRTVLKLDGTLFDPARRPLALCHDNPQAGQLVARTTRTRSRPKAPGSTPATQAT